MSNAPAIVRLLRFPESLRLSRKGGQFEGPLQRSGPLVLSERQDAIDVTFRITAPGFSFLTGGTSIAVTEAFNEGEQRDVLVPWQLVAEGDRRIDLLVLEVAVAYSGSPDVHTASVPLQLEYGISRRQAAVAAGTALAAAAVAAVAASRRRRTVIVNDEEDVELSLFNFAPTAKTTSPRTPVKGAQVSVRDAGEADVAVLNVGRAPARSAARSAPARTSKNTAAKKRTPATKSAAKKAAPAKKSASKTATTKNSSKKAPARKAGGTRRGSTASRSARRTGARGSSAARKSASRRSTRKSR